MKMTMTRWQETFVRAKPFHRMNLALEKLKVTVSNLPPHTLGRTVSPENQIMVPRLKDDRQSSDKLLPTLLTVKLRAQNWSFSARATTKPPPGPMRAGWRFLHRKWGHSESLTTCVKKWSASFLWSAHSWCVHYVTPLQDNRPSGPQHKSTPQIDTKHGKQSA